MFTLYYILVLSMMIVHVFTDEFKGFRRVKGVISTRNGTFSFASFWTCSADRCVLACTAAAGNSCSMAQYNVVSGQCKRYNWKNVKWLRLREQGKETDYDVYIARDQKVLYIGGDELVYAFSLEEGRENCHRVGGALASTADLQTAQHGGWEVCACGWLDNGDAYFLVSTITPRCGTTKLHKCSLQVAFGAHCVFI